jgi:predicted dehydrogenase
MKVVVFGAGYWGKNYVRELGRRCVLVVEPDPVKARNVSEQFGVPSAPALPTDVEFDGAVLAVPPMLNVALAEPLLLQGKYVLVEKPFALSTAEARRLVNYKRCMAAHIYLWHPSVVELAERLPSLDVDHLFSRRTNNGPIRTWPVEWDLGVHDVSIFYYLSGWEKPMEVWCHRGENYALLNLEFSRWDASSYVSWLGGPKTRQLDVVEKTGEREIFDDVSTVLETPPLALMLEEFLTGAWSDRGQAQVGYDVVEILERMTR